MRRQLSSVAKTREALRLLWRVVRQQNDLHDKRRHRDEAQFRSSLSARAKHKQRSLAVNSRRASALYRLQMKEEGKTSRKNTSTGFSRAGQERKTSERSFLRASLANTMRIPASSLAGDCERWNELGFVTLVSAPLSNISMIYFRWSVRFDS